MYEQRITRRDPGCIVLLLDRSDSMKVPWGTTGMSLAEGAALAINNLLFELCMKATSETGGAVKHHFDIGVFGYGACPGMGGGEGVESAFSGALAGRFLVGLPEVASSHIGLRETPSIDAMNYTSKTPIWIEAVHGYRTPMCEAIATAGAHVHDWATAHANSFPPIIINITDGMVTDQPYEGADLPEWGERLKTIATSDGPSLLFNIFLSPSQAMPVVLPPSAQGLPDPGPVLFTMSSHLPEKMVAAARSHSIQVQPGGRGFAFNADLATLVKFLDIGTQVV